MITLQRTAVPFVNALFITAGLMYLMYLMVRSDEPQLRLSKPISGVIINAVIEEEEVKRIIDRPPEPPEVAATPEVPTSEPPKLLDAIQGPNLATNIQFKKSGSLPKIYNSQLVMVLGIPPEYPARAIQRGIEGYAVVGFSVDTAGAVFNPFIIESEPETIFDRSALKAIMKFKYKARLVDGKPVSTGGQRYLFTYKLDQ